MAFNFDFDGPDLSYQKSQLVQKKNCKYSCPSLLRCFELYASSCASATFPQLSNLVLIIQNDRLCNHINFNTVITFV